MGGALKKMMQVLGIDDSDPNGVTAEQAGLTDEEMGAIHDRQQLNEQGLVPPPEKEAFGAGFMSPDGSLQRASSLDVAKSMSEASNTVKANTDVTNQAERQRAVREAMALLGDTARKHDLPGLFPTSPDRNELLGDKEQLGNAFDRAGVNPDDQQPEEPAAPAPRPQPVRTGASIAQKEQLAEAFKRGGKAPEVDPAAEQLATRAEAESPPPEGAGASPEQKAALAEAFKRGGVNPEQQQAAGGDSGGPLGQVSKLVQGSTDPRMAELKAALAKRDKLLRLADAERNAGSGADIVGDTNFNAHAGEGTRARAEAGVDSVLKQTEEGRKMSADTRAQGDFESRQLDSTQRRQLNMTDEARRAAAEGRAVNEEGRKAKTFDVQAGRSDPNSAVSRNARAEMEDLYGAQWKKLPPDVRDTFTADDVDRFFKEVSAKDFATGMHSGGMQDRFEEKQVQDYNKSRVTDRTVEAVNNLMGRLEDKTPIQGFDAAKGWAQAQKIPVLGGLLSGAGNSAVRGTEMEGIAQDAMAVMQQISLDTSGKVLNESEIRNIEKRLGLAAGQGEDAFRRAMSREFDAIQSKADRDFNSYSPGAKSRIEQRRLRPSFRAKRPDYAPKENTVLGERAKDTFGLGSGSGADLGYGD
jgi:hypothetical protein